MNIKKRLHRRLTHRRMYLLMRWGKDLKIIRAPFQMHYAAKPFEEIVRDLRAEIANLRDPMWRPPYTTDIRTTKLIRWIDDFRNELVSIYGAERILSAPFNIIDLENKT